MKPRFNDLPKLTPSLTPKQILQAGVFGGTLYNTTRARKFLESINYANDPDLKRLVLDENTKNQSLLTKNRYRVRECTFSKSNQEHLSLRVILLWYIDYFYGKRQRSGDNIVANIWSNAVARITNYMDSLNLTPEQLASTTIEGQAKQGLLALGMEALDGITGVICPDGVQLVSLSSIKSVQVSGLGTNLLSINLSEVVNIGLTGDITYTLTETHLTITPRPDSVPVEINVGQPQVIDVSTYPDGFYVYRITSSTGALLETFVFVKAGKVFGMTSNINNTITLAYPQTIPISQVTVNSQVTVGGSYYLWWQSPNNLANTVNGFSVSDQRGEYVNSLNPPNSLSHNRSATIPNNYFATDLRVDITINEDSTLMSISKITLGCIIPVITP